MNPRFTSSLVLPAAYDGKIAFFAFRGQDLVVREPGDGGFVEVPVLRNLEELGFEAIRTQVLGHFDGLPVCSAEIDPGAKLPPGYAALSLRRLFGRMDQAFFEVAGTAFQIQYWDKTHQVCSACAEPLEYRAGSRCKVCPKCKIEYFPKVAPAMIVLVEDGETILMARGPHLPPGMYALVAGFLEPGETLEQCVAREVLEETGIEVDNVRYFASQPWPFPHQVMIGFVARRSGGELRVDRSELEDARFFRRDALPMLPPPISVARQLIDAWIERKT